MKLKVDREASGQGATAIVCQGAAPLESIRHPALKRADEDGFPCVPGMATLRSRIGYAAAGASSDSFFTCSREIRESMVIPHCRHSR